MNRNFLPFLATCLSASATTPLLAEMQPCSLFSDGAVLQREMPVPVWGTARDGEKVTVKFHGQEVSAVAKEGKWMVGLEPMKAGGPFTMTISGDNVVEIKNILIGEVWICSGQSNMEVSVSDSETPDKAIASSEDSMMRLFDVPRLPLPPGLIGPIPEMTTRWAECTPATAAKFSGVGYFFGQKLREALNVPVGLINIPYGGSYAALWMDSKTRTEVAGGGTYRNGWLYDSMLMPLQPYAVRGVIWYQGESDADNSLRYRKEFPALIKNWRDDWKQGDFPFLFVQLTGFNFYKKEVASEPQEQTTWAELREAQALTAASVPNTAMVVTTDLGSPENVHPVRKKEVGDRLAMAASGMVYGQDVSYKSPEFREMKIEDGKATVVFSNAEGGLVADGESVAGFAMAGEDRKFYNADAVVKDDRVTVSTSKVPHPVAVRYGWANYPLTNLFSKTGLPAAPFRTDDFPFIKCKKCKSLSGKGITNGICNECGGESEEYYLP